MIFPEHMQPPYLLEPSLEKAELARRLACRVLMGHFVDVPAGSVRAYRRHVREMHAVICSMPLAERDRVSMAMYRAARAEREAARK